MGDTKELMEKDYVRINRVAMMLDISDHTIRRWYKWWESPEFEKPDNLYLPPYYHMDRRGTKFFKITDIPHLKEFRNKIQSTHKGAMAEFNAIFQWGGRGKKILENRDIDPNEVRKKMR